MNLGVAEYEKLFGAISGKSLSSFVGKTFGLANSGHGGCIRPQLWHCGLSQELSGDCLLQSKRAALVEKVTEMTVLKGDLWCIIGLGFGKGKPLDS